MSPGWWARRLTEIPHIGPADPGDPEWYPLQHHFGLTAFGANVYVAREEGDELVGQHDETDSGHEELYFLTSGRARFRLGGEDNEVEAGTVVAVPDPTVQRSAVALEAGTALVAVGGPANPEFVSSWRPDHFEGVPRAE
jgi:hypothetical protein